MMQLKGKKIFISFMCLMSLVFILSCSKEPPKKAELSTNNSSSETTAIEAKEIVRNLNHKYGQQLINLSKEKYQAKEQVLEKFSPAQLVASNGLNEAKNSTRKLKEIVVKYHEILNKHMSEKDEKLSKLLGANQPKLNQLNKESLNLASSLFEIENNIISADEQFINFIQTNIQHITVKNNNLMFDDINLMAMHNTITSNINALLQRELDVSIQLQEVDSHVDKELQQLHG